MPYDNLPYSPKRITKDREEKLRLQHELLDRIFSRPMPSPEDEGLRAQKFNEGKQIGQFSASLHKVTALMDQVERYIAFAPESIQQELYKEARYNLTRFPSAQVFEELGKRVQVERQNAVAQGYAVPSPLDFSFPAPPGVLTQFELTKVKNARANG